MHSRETEPPPFREGQPVTLIQIGRATGRYQTGWTAVLTGTPYPYVGDPGVTVLPGDVRGLLVQALLDAAELHEPSRCVVCVEAPEPCDGCRGDEGKVREYRSLLEAFGAGVAVS